MAAIAGLRRHQDAAQVPPAARPDRPSIPLGNLVFAAHYRPMATRDWAAAFGIWCRSFDRQPIIAYSAALACMALALALCAALNLWIPISSRLPRFIQRSWQPRC